MGIELWHPCTLRKSEKQCIFPRSFCDKLANQGWLTKQRVLQDFHAPPSTCPALCALAMGQVKVATRNKIPRGPLQATYECTRSKLSRPHCLWHAANCHTNLNHWKLALTMKHGSSTIWESTYNVENMGNISYSTFWTSDSCTVILPYIYTRIYIQFWRWQNVGHQSKLARHAAILMEPTSRSSFWKQHLCHTGVGKCPNWTQILGI